MDKAERFVGIDLGTTYSAIAYVDSDGRPVNLPNAHGDLLTPSVIQILPNRKILIGKDAEMAAADLPDRTAINVKRDMGESFYREPLGGKQFSPEALSALILKQLALDARALIGDVRDVVITVPAYFGDARRKATEDAGRIAGLRIVDVLNEPTAAALANAFQEFLKKNEGPISFSGAAEAALAPQTTLVFDLGGGTFDVTIIRIDGQRFDVLATGGEVRLGGIDFDERLLQFFADEFARRYGVDPRDDLATATRIRHSCELAKRALSEREDTILVIEHLGRRLNLPVSRAQFESMTADLLTRTQLSTEMLLEDAMLTWDRIDTVLLVGGSTRMPCVGQMLTKISGRTPSVAGAPDQIVSHGAAIHAAILQMNQATGLSTPRDVKAASTPTELSNKSKIFSETVQAAARQVQLENVNAHSLGVVVRAPRENRIVHSHIIQRNTPLPASRTRVFGTEVANQSVVRLRVVEGESRDPSACSQIGECVIHRLPPGLPQGSKVEVTFSFDASGRLRVRAMDLTSQTVAEVEIERSSGFKPTELKSMAESVTELMEPRQ